MAKTTRRVGVILFQLGGPDTLEAIEPFLFNLFCDPDIIDFPLRPHWPPSTGKIDLNHPRQQSPASLFGYRRRITYSTLYGTASAGVAVVLEDVRGWRPLLCRHALLASFYR